MKKGIYWGSLLLATFIFLATGPVHGSPQGSSGAPGFPNEVNAVEGRITFQAFIEDDGDPIEEAEALIIQLTDGTNVLDTFGPADVPAVNGVITVELQFGPELFTGSPRFLEIEINTVDLSPIRVTSVPFAYTSGNAGAAGGSAIAAVDNDGPRELVIRGMTQSLASRSVTPPADGFVIVMGSCQSTVFHEDNEPTGAYYGVNNATVFRTTGTFLHQISDEAFGDIDGQEADGFAAPVTVHSCFAVTGGQTETFHFLGMLWSGDPTEDAKIVVTDINLTVIFIPTELPGDGFDVSTIAQNLPEEGDMSQESQTRTPVEGDLEESLR